MFRNLPECSFTEKDSKKKKKGSTRFKSKRVTKR